MGRAILLGVIVAVVIATVIIALDRFGVINLRGQPAVAVATAAPTEEIYEEDGEEVDEPALAGEPRRPRKHTAKRTKKEEPKPAEPAKEPPPRKKGTSYSLPSPGAINSPRLPAELPDHKVAAVISSQSQEYQRCLNDAVKKKEDLDGRMMVQMTINAWGKPEDLHVKPGKHERTSYARCMINRMKSLRFPSFEGEPITIVFPIDVDVN
jgi:hypothetical protein